MVHYFLVVLVGGVLQSCFRLDVTASVPGRIRLLIVSMVTMNGISTVGVPWGTKCSNM